MKLAPLLQAAVKVLTAACREAQGKLQEAISDFEQVRVLEPTNKDAQNKLGHAKKLLDEKSEAA